MADNSNTILKKLQQHQIQPPADAFEKAWERCMDETDGEGNERNAFGKLKNYDLQAPSVNLKKIMAGESGAIADKKRLIIPTSWMRAAAVLLLVAIGSVLYMAFSDKKNRDEDHAIAEETKNTPAAKKIDSSVIPVINNDVAGTDNTGINAENHSNATLKSTRDNNEYLENINNFINNDVFYTLVNYKESAKDKWFYKTLSAKKITLNQYSYINLSDKMVAMLQDLYLTKKNGKMARKARKAKRKFEKWRKKDEKYFDTNSDRNAADIIDLSDFLMHN